MFISLETIGIWGVTGDFAPCEFFESLRLITSDNDVLIVGSYNASCEIYEWLVENESKDIFTKPFEDTFRLNQKEFPRGRFFHFRINNQLLKKLATFSQLKQGSLDKDLFFDHVLVYREGKPIFPLIDFHDAFSGGVLRLSGLYTENELKDFIKSLNIDACFEVNGELPESVLKLLNTYHIKPKN